MKNASIYITISVSVLISVLITIGIMIVILSQFTIIQSKTQQTPLNAAVLVSINITGSISSVVNLKVGISGNGLNYSVPVYVISKCSAPSQIVENVSGPVVEPQSNVSITGTGNSSNVAIPRIINWSIVPCNTAEHIIFANLKPYSYYNVTISGTKSPYCVRGVICPPMLILLIFKSSIIETGPSNSIVNVSFNV